jgi:hypothetical protein
VLRKIIPAGSDIADAVLAAVTIAYHNNETEIPLAFESEADYNAALADIDRILRRWKDGNTIIGSYSYTYSNGGLVIAVYNVSF